MVLFGRGFAASRLMLGLVLDAAVGVEGADGAVALLEDLAAFFEQGLDGIDQLLLVAFSFGLALGDADGLCVLIHVFMLDSTGCLHDRSCLGSA